MMEHKLKKLLEKSDAWDKKGLCIHCGSKKKHNEQFDALFCEKCDYWTERICPNKTCEFCKDRPKYPSSIQKNHKV